MKSVLASFKPQYCELIASGRKTVELRKTRPKLDTPFKVYMYCTKAKSIEDIILKGDWEIANGKVIGEFVCDEILEWEINIDATYFVYDDELAASCLDQSDLRAYGNGKNLYAWHISDLVIYDEPLELSDFFYACNKPQGTDCSKCVDAREQSCKALTRPPQSWCYVEEV